MQGFRGMECITFVEEYWGEMSCWLDVARISCKASQTQRLYIIQKCLLDVAETCGK